ncbi:MAG: hypothetical protein LUE29_13230 [Lachnospiraceae bacterium]|nr:hypothetical protein [Lachnospiraceae bacterium]
MKKQTFPYIVCSIAAVLLLTGIFAACAQTGGNEMIETTINSETVTQSDSGNGDGDNEAETTETSVAVTPVLTDEEAAADHLTAEVSDQITIDAYITPSSYYEDGIGEWELVDVSEDEMRTWVEMDGDTLLYGRVTFDEFVEMIDQMTDELGPVYREEWEAVKGTDDINAFMYRSSLKIWTPSYKEGEPYVDISLLSENVDLDYLSMQTLCDAVTKVAKTLYPEVGEHYSLSANTKEYQSESARLYNVFWNVDRMDEDLETTYEWYYLEYYVTLDGIPLKNAEVFTEIPAGSMAEDYVYYSEYYLENSWRSGCTPAIFMSCSLSEEGMYLYFDNLYTYERYQEKQEVIGINEILAETVPVLADYEREILVDEIELVMAETEVEEADGKYRPVYKPFWTVNFYMSTLYSGEEFFISYQLVFDAYTGELIYQADIQGQE